MTVYISQCVLCKNANPDIGEQNNYSCRAFPDGIPDTILTGRADHTKQFKGDKGIRFESKK